MKTGRRRKVIQVSRPAVPHLHFVNLRQEEKMINKALFDADTDASRLKNLQMIKTIDKIYSDDETVVI